MLSINIVLILMHQYRIHSIVAILSRSSRLSLVTYSVFSIHSRSLWRHRSPKKVNLTFFWPIWRIISSWIVWCHSHYRPIKTVACRSIWRDPCRPAKSWPFLTSLWRHRSPKKVNSRRTTPPPRGLSEKGLTVQCSWWIYVCTSTSRLSINYLLDHITCTVHVMLSNK